MDGEQLIGAGILDHSAVAVCDKRARIGGRGVRRARKAPRGLSAPLFHIHEIDR